MRAKTPPAGAATIIPALLDEVAAAAPEEAEEAAPDTLDADPDPDAEEALAREADPAEETAEAPARMVDEADWAAAEVGTDAPEAPEETAPRAPALPVAARPPPVAVNRGAV